MSSDVEIVAEVGSVHDGSFGNAIRLIDAVAGTGADTVKFQTHIARAETLRDAPSPSYFSDEDRYTYFTRTSFTEAQWRELKQHAERRSLRFLSSPFSLEAVDLLERVGIDAYKIPSGEVTNVPLLERVTATGKPVLLSSGMSDWEELDTAVKALRGGGPLTVLQCTSLYPCPPDRVGLNVIGEMRERYGLPVGFSDHSEGVAGAIAAVALGADVIEKHFTFSRLMYGSDAPLATEPGEFRHFVDELRRAQAIRNNPVDKKDLARFRELKRAFEKSVVTVVPVMTGTLLEPHHLGFKKPGDGISAARYREVLGRRASRDLPADTKLTEDDLS